MAVIRLHAAYCVCWLALTPLFEKRVNILPAVEASLLSSVFSAPDLLHFTVSALLIRLSVSFVFSLQFLALLPPPPHFWDNRETCPSYVCRIET